MKSEAERDFERRMKGIEEMTEILEQLPRWDQFEILLRIYWMVFRNKVRNFPTNWIRKQVKLEEEIKLHGMPFAVRLQLEKWFNYPPHDEDKHFLIQGKKIWYHCFAAEDNHELHLYHKSHYPGTIWFQPEMDGTATIIGIHIQEEYRNCGLGTIAFWEAVHQVKGKVSCLKGVLECEYYPEPERSLRWLRKQGFMITPKENGDYELELKITS